MPSPIPDDLPQALLAIRTRPLFTLQIDVGALQAAGGTEGAARRIGPIPGGSFRGERLSGRVLDGGADWQTLHSDGAVALDARIVLEADDGGLIAMTYTGLRHGPPEVMARLARGEAVDPADYYFRISAAFATSAPRHEWLNRILAVGAGHRLPGGPIYTLFELL
ncbi:MAG: DUF3237 domain-containing protein [Caulobacteraceae bacterium]